jgi:hypothetical protein
MPQLPQAIDYGKRPSLRTSRIDSPGTGSQESAAALTSAAKAFADVLDQKKEKKDALTYALARNEIIAADLLEREKLADDQDWGTHDERYGQGFKTAREGIAQRYPNMDPHDRAILGAEADLIGARGGVAVRARSRELQVDEGYSRLIAGQATAREDLLKAKDSATRNKIIEGQLEAITAAREAGFIATDEAAEIMRQKLTQDFAVASIGVMEDEEQIEIITDSLRRRGYGGSSSEPGETIEQTDQRVRDKRAAAGLPEYPPGVEPGDKGSPYQGDFVGGVSEWGASILKSQGKNPSGLGPVSKEDVIAAGDNGNVGDFVHADTLAGMLKAAMGRDKENRERTESQAVVSRAYEIFPDDHDARMKYIDKALDGTVQKKAETDAELRNARQERLEAKAGVDLWKNYGATIRELKNSEEPLTMNDIPPAHLQIMNESQIRDLEAAMKRAAEDTQFAPVTRYFSPDKDTKSLDMWKDMPTFGEGSKAEADLHGDDWTGALDRDDWIEADSLQRSIKALEVANLPWPNVGPLVITTLEANKYGGLSLTADEKKAIAGRLELRLEGEVARWQNTNNQKAPDSEISRILSELMLEKAWETSGWDEEIRVSTATTLQLQTMYLPLADVVEAQYVGTEPKYQGLNMYDYLKQRSRDLTVGPGQKGAEDEWLQRAYFAYKSKMSTDEVDKRLRGE